MGYSPGFLLKIDQISTLSNSPEIDKNSRARSQKSFQKGFGGISESLERFPGLAQIRHFQNHGLQPRVFAQNRPNFDPLEFSRNRYKQSRKELEIILDGFRRHFREFGAISRTCPNPPFLKTMGYSPGFLLKIGQISTLSNSPEIDTNSRARSQKSFQKGFGGISESLERFPDLPKSVMFKTMGYSPGFLLKIGQISTLEFTRKRDKQSRKELEIILEGFWRHFREFGAIPRTCRNPPCSKPWAIAQGFCSKSAKFRPSRIHPKTRQTVAQRVRNHFRRVLEAFQRVWSDSPDLPKSAMFKTMGYSPGFLLKNVRFSTLRILPKSTQTVAQRVRNHFRRLQEAIQRVWRDFPDLPKSAIFENHGLQPRLFAQNRPIFDTLKVTRNRHKQSRKELEIILEGFRRHFREFGAISRTSPNPSCSKPWAIAQGFCSKSAKFRRSRIHPKSTQTVAQGVRNHFRRVLEAFQRVWSDSRTCPNPSCSKPWAIAQGFCSKSAKFRPSRIHPKTRQTVAQRVRNHFRRVLEAFQRVWSDSPDLPKSAMFKTMGYSPGFLLKNFRFSTLRILPKSTQTVAQRVRNHFRRVQEAFQRVWIDFQDLPKSAIFKTMGYSPGFLLKRPIFDTLKVTRNRHKQSRKQLEIILEGFRRHFREFGAISRTCPNPPFSKPWAIAQGFCSKSAKFRPSRIHPKTRQTVAQRVRNHFRRVLEAFQRVWSDSPDLPKSGMFKTMGYSPGFLLKIGQISTLSNSPENETNSRAKSQKSFQKGLGGISESLDRFPGLAEIRHFQNHGLQPWVFAQKANFRHPQIHPKSTQTVAQRVRNHFRRIQEAFQRVWSDFQDLPKSDIFKTMGYSPGFLLKNVRFSTLLN